MKKCSLAFSITLSLLMAACGGGGGGGSSTPAPVPAPAPAPPPPPEQPDGFTVSGAVNVSANLDIDGDTNNLQGGLAANDSLATAQEVSNPTTLLGYVKQPGTGESGANDDDGDRDDYFRIELLAGQRVTLLVADFEQADADLYLYSLDGEILDFSLEAGEVESLFIPEDGLYIINVNAFFGATNYALAIGSSNATANMISSGPATAPEIIPWQAVVKHRDEESARGLALDRRMGMHRRAGGRHAGGKTRPHLMAMERTALTLAQQISRLGPARHRRELMKSESMRARWETLMTIKTLRRDTDIVYAEANYLVRAMAAPNDEFYSFQWHYPLINLPAAWELTTGDPSVIVAVVDTGILSGHPDLNGQLVAGYDFIADPQRARDGTGIDSNPEDEGDGGELGNSSFHGTHVSGTIAAASDNQIGVAGVAWNARIMPLRVLGVEGGSTYDVGQAVLYAAGLPNDSGTVPTQRADIINLSLGGPQFIASAQALFDEVRAAGVIVVAAAGNDASNVPSYPASYDGVISVSAVDSQRNPTRYSNFGSSVDLAAPGGNNGVDINGDGYPDGVLSTGASVTNSGILNYVYSFLNGTSMASPHVAGVLALMKSVNPQLTPADIDALLVRGELTDDLGTPGRDDRSGHGLINAQRAVFAALDAAGNPPDESPLLGASSSQLNFGSAALSLNLVLQNSGLGALELLELDSSESWMEITPDNIDNDGLGSYEILVDREDLTTGIYGAQITAVSSINTVVVEVLVSVVDQPTGGNVGPIYLLLSDVVTQETVAQFNAVVRNGVYAYEFNDIPAGSYELFAGTDSDNDLFICDAGEACGAYLTLDQPALIELEGDTEGIEFPMEYRVIIPTLNSLTEQAPIQTKTGIPRTH